MCNDYRLEIDVASVAEDFEHLKMKIKMFEDTPNVPPRKDVKIPDVAPIVRSVAEWSERCVAVAELWSD